MPAYALPADCQHIAIQRIRVRHGVSRDLGALLIEDIRRAIEHFKAHPITRPIGPAKARGFHH